MLRLYLYKNKNNQVTSERLCLILVSVLCFSILSFYVKSQTQKMRLFFILSTQSVHPMRVHNPEYQLPVTSGSRVTGKKPANFN